MKHRKIEPGTPEYDQLRRWFLPPASGGDGLSVRAALARAQALGWSVKRTALDGYRREVLGQASANADVQARAVASGRVAPGGIPVGPSAPLALPAVHAPTRAPRSVAERLTLFELQELQLEIWEREQLLAGMLEEHLEVFGAPWTPPPRPPRLRFCWVADEEEVHERLMAEAQAEWRATAKAAAA